MKKKRILELNDMIDTWKKLDKIYYNETQPGPRKQIRGFIPVKDTDPNDLMAEILPVIKTLTDDEIKYVVYGL